MQMLTSALLLPVIAHAAAVQAEAPEAEVRDALASMNSAAADLNADEFMGWYWDSPSLVITFDGETMRGWEKILAEQRKWWSDKSSGIKFAEQRPAEIMMQGSGVATSIQWMAVGPGDGGNPSKLVITSVWKKLPQGWRIVVAHESLVTPKQ